MSFLLANLGLNNVIAMSVPVLSIIYPVAITVVLLILLARFIPTKRIAQQIPIVVVGYCISAKCDEYEWLDKNAIHCAFTFKTIFIRMATYRSDSYCNRLYRVNIY